MFGSPHSYVRNSNDPLPARRQKKGEARAFVSGLFAAKNRPLLSSEVSLLMLQNGVDFDWQAVHIAVTRTLKCEKFTVKEVGKGLKGFTGKFWRLPEQPELSKDEGRRIIAEYLVAKAEHAQAKLIEGSAANSELPIAEPEAGNEPAEAEAKARAKAQPAPMTAAHLAELAEPWAMLGIIVDFAGKTVSNGNKTIEFERSEVQWHIFRIALAAFPKVFSLDAMRKNYPGSEDNIARQVATMHLNKKLARIGIRVKHRQLIEIGKKSD